MSPSQTSTVRHESTINSSLDTVWAFYTDPAGLEAITPRVAGLTVRDLSSPPGSPTDGLPAGTRMQLSIGPWPFRIQWVAEIVSRERTGRRGQFVDQQLEGPFAVWEHTHTFIQKGDQTQLVDKITYQLPHRLPNALVWLPLKLMLIDRHRRTANHCNDAK